MPGDRAKAQQLLDQVGFAAKELPHPVDLLTVEMAAAAAGVSPTTVDSAVSSAAAFRDLTLQAAVRMLETKPNVQVWAALQQTVSRPTTERSLSGVLGARAKQLADDPAFPLLLSGFERLDSPGVASAVNDTLRLLLVELWPFVQTVRSSAGYSMPADLADEALFGSLLCVLGESMRRLLAPADDPATDAAFALLLAEILDRVIDSPASTTPGGRLLPQRSTTYGPAVSGLAVDAVQAGAALLLSSSIEPATSLTVADAVKRCGVSTAGFYRFFGSMSEFEHQLIIQVGGSLADGFDEHFFNQDLERLETELEPQPDLVEVFSSYYAQTTEHHQRHAETGRQGVELLPWLNSPVLGPLVRASYHDRFEKRGEFFSRLLASLGLRPIGGLGGSALSSFMGVTSMSIEFLLRNAPDRQYADAFLLGQSSDFFQLVFGSVSD